MMGNSLHIQNLISPEALLKLVQQLHSSLDTKVILDSFYEVMNQQFNLEGMNYTPQHNSHEYRFGALENKNISYQLTLNKHLLGDLSFSRKKPFDSDETTQIEELICLLLAPLNNAQQHYQALQTAIHDPLTNLLNRVSLSEHLTHEISIAKRQSIPLSILIIDIDDFKVINDSHGHLVGDAILKHFAHLLSSAMRESDLAFRLGGDEFLVLMSNTDSDGALCLAQRLHHVTSDKRHASDNEVGLNYTISIGIAYHQANQTAEILMKNADKALYRAKEKGKNTTEIYTS